MPTGTSARSRSLTLCAEELVQVHSRRVDEIDVGLPPPVLVDDGAALPNDQPAGRDLTDSPKQCPGGAGAPEREDLVDAREIRSGGHLSGCEERFRL